MRANENQMTEESQELDAAAILRRVITIAAFGGTGSGILILIMFNAVARFTPAQEIYLLKLVFILTPVCILGSFPVYSIFCRPFLKYIESCKTGEVTDEIRLKALQWALSCPRRCVIFGYSFFPLTTLIVTVCLAMAFDGFDRTQSTTLILCAVLMGFPCEMAMYIPFREAVEGVTNKLATEIKDPEVRRAHAPFFSLTRKVSVALMAMSFISITVMASLAQMRAKYSIETLATERLSTTVEALVSQYASVEDGEALVRYGNETYAHALDATIVFIPRDLDQPVDGILAAGLTEAEIDIVRENFESGSAEAVITPNLFAWAQLPDDSGAMAIFSNRKKVSDHVHDARGPIILFAICIIFVTVMLTLLFARDMRRTFDALRAQVRRVSKGDLGRYNMFEVEDELGDLSRDIDEMSGSLRFTVGKVMDTASKVDTAAHDISNVAQHINSVTTGQFQGIVHASDAVASVTAQVDGITNSVQDLTCSVEESTGAAAQIKAVAEGLNQHTVALSGKVTDSESAIEQMIARIQEVSEKTDRLSVIVREGIDNVGMLAEQISQIESSALETARLSKSVTAAAEKGSDRVGKTIEGMQAIAGKTALAQEVIEALGIRINDISHIVDVIDDVADETNLLALNAAIISAQAGENGRAFSVVSDEIKELADRTTNSTKEIAELIRDLQQQSTNAVQVIGEGVSHVGGGVSLSEEAGSALDEITRSAEESGKQVESIVSSVHDHRSSARRVMDMMERVGEDAETIQRASMEYAAGTQIVRNAQQGVGELTLQVGTTTNEQERSTSFIAQNLEGVKSAVEGIQAALQEQLESCQQTEESLEELRTQTRENEQAATHMSDAKRVLLEQSRSLREDIRKFKL